ncbi:MAG TPA: hypothetical protein VM925_05920 [Labilithrix sp.]|nr:hypothetical protein [Labilithrix sp.]
MPSVAPDAATEPENDSPETETEKSTPDASLNVLVDAGNGKIGTLKDTGITRLDVDLSSRGSYTCESACAGKGGTCNVGANGAGWSDYKNDNGNSFGSRISSCDETNSYRSGNSTLTSMYCYCDGLPVPPTVRVKKSEGAFTCAKVCESWSLTCNKSTTRKHYAYKTEEETSATPLADCNAAPVEPFHHYTCACDAAQ